MSGCKMYESLKRQKGQPHEGTASASYSHTSTSTNTHLTISKFKHEQTVIKFAFKSKYNDEIWITAPCPFDHLSYNLTFYKF